MEWPWRGSRWQRVHDECEQLRRRNENLEVSLRSSETALARAEARADAAEATAASLRAETERVMSELVFSRLSKNGRSAAEDEKFKRLARTVQKFVHPDRAGSDQVVAAALENIFKVLRGEIEAIERDDRS